MSPAPKRIMSFDGGGIRGVFSLQIAARIEQIFRQAHGLSDLVLADVVEFFAGTSTGAIIAAFLAWGYPVAEIERLFLSYAKQMFSRQWFWRRIRAKYQEHGVAELFRENFREDDGSPALLGSGKLKGLLLVVVANATTGSPWPITNNPRAKYNDKARDDCNLNIPLWQLLRASTAAPTYFQPEPITLGRHKFLFVDGGVTPYNNPSLLAVLMATLPGYNICWPTGADALHLISIGTARRTHYSKRFASQIYLWNSLDYFVHGIMDAVSVNQDMHCRLLGHCLHGASSTANWPPGRSPARARREEIQLCPVQLHDGYG